MTQVFPGELQYNDSMVIMPPVLTGGYDPNVGMRSTPALGYMVPWGSGGEEITPLTPLMGTERGAQGGGQMSGLATVELLSMWLEGLGKVSEAPIPRLTIPGQAQSFETVQGTIRADRIIATSLSAINADLGNITAGEIILSSFDGIPTTAALARTQIKMNGSGYYGRWRGSNLPAWSGTESGSGNDYNSGWRKIIDISGNEVRLSFDSFDSGDTLGIDSTFILPYTIMMVYPEKFCYNVWTSWDSTVIAATTGSEASGTFAFWAESGGSGNADFLVELYRIDSPDVVVHTVVDEELYYLTATKVVYSSEGISLSNGENYYFRLSMRSRNAGRQIGMSASALYSKPVTEVTKKT